LATSALAASAEVMPPPIITTVRLGSSRAMGISCLAEVLDRLGLLRSREGLAAEVLHVDCVECRQPRITDHAPEDLVAVPPVDRVGETRLLEERKDQLVEPLREWNAVIGDLALAKAVRKNIALRGRELFEFLPLAAWHAACAAASPARKNPAGSKGS